MDISRFINFKNKWHLVGSLVLLTIIGYILHWCGYFIYSYPLTPKFIKESPEPIVVVVFLIYLITLFVLIKLLLSKFWRRIFYLRNRVYKFRSQDWPIKWMFSGRPEAIASSELVVQSSRAGCLLKNHYWKDFRMTFEMKFLDGLDRKVGIVFRAEDLDNYFMLELSDKQGEIKPHVRYRGGWDVMSSIKTNAFNSRGYIGIVLEVKNNVASLKVNNHLELVLVLPTHVDVMYRESGSNKQPKETTPGEKYVQEIPFRLKFGMIGFRAHPGQGAKIRGLVIEPL